LSKNNKYQNNNEDEIGVNAFKDVELVVDLSGSEHVEDLHEHESSENEGQVTGWSDNFFHLTGVEFITVPVSGTTRVDHILVNPDSGLSIQITWCFNLFPINNTIISVGIFLNRLRDHVLTSEEEGEKNNTLPNRLAENVLGHLARNDVVFTVLGLSQEQTLLWQFSSEGK